MTTEQGFNPEWMEGAEQAAPAEPATLERISQLAETARRLEQEMERLTIELAEKQDRHSNIMRNIMPDMMLELGMKDFTLTDGSKVAIKESINASISEANKPAAFAWLEEHSFDGIIKTKVSADFGKGEIDGARKAVEALEQAGFSAAMDRSVHAMTLKSFVKEQLEEGNAIPLDLFGVFEFKEAKITRPRARRSR